MDFQNPHSQFYKAVHISYPNERDRALAREHGVAPVGKVFFDGLPNRYRAIGAAHRLKDWTENERGFGLIARQAASALKEMTARE